MGTKGKKVKENVEEKELLNNEEVGADTVGPATVIKPKEENELHENATRLGTTMDPIYNNEVNYEDNSTVFQKKAKKRTKVRKVLAHVAQMDLMSDTIYIVTGKPDQGAPSGLADMGVSKIPFDGNKSLVSCPFDRIAGVFDTGFYPSSACFKDYDEDDIEEEVIRRNDNILKPYERLTQTDLSQSNFTFWDEYQSSLWMGRIFNTHDPKEAFELYVALQSGLLTPKELDGDPAFINSMYCIEDKSLHKDFRQARETNKMDAITDVVIALRRGGNEREEMVDLLVYLDIVSIIGTKEDEFIKYSFSNWLDAKASNIDMFVDMRSRFLTKENKNVLRTYMVLKYLSQTRKVIVDKDGIIYDGVTLGNDLKSAALRLAKEGALLDQRIKLYEEYGKLKDKESTVGKI